MNRILHTNSLGLMLVGTGMLHEQGLGEVNDLKEFGEGARNALCEESTAEDNLLKVSVVGVMNLSLTFCPRIPVVPEGWQLRMVNSATSSLSQLL